MVDAAFDRDLSDLGQKVQDAYAASLGIRPVVDIAPTGSKKVIFIDGELEGKGFEFFAIMNGGVIEHGFPWLYGRQTLPLSVVYDISGRFLNAFEKAAKSLGATSLCVKLKGLDPVDLITGDAEPQNVFTHPEYWFWTARGYKFRPNTDRSWQEAITLVEYNGGAFVKHITPDHLKGFGHLL